ncbi:MAG: tRNA pseudouridine38-40 synthase [Clostridiales bacterium]|nr:tRNA pseudouridine38-40 synthase [Clostridiales bacterium]
MQYITITIAYDGTAYHGWQKQNNTRKTIQGVLEDVLSESFGEMVTIHGSGRTDAGVHAKGQVANFRIQNLHKKNSLDFDAKKREANCLLPSDISILDMQTCKKHFHARKSAEGKIYSYTIWNSSISPVFERNYVYQIEDELDVGAMKEASQLFLGTHDFTGFATAKTGQDNGIRTIYGIEFQVVQDKITMVYKGSGFLYNMVRIMSGTLIEIGLHKRSIDSIGSIYESGLRREAGFLAPAKGLCLETVFYKKEDIQ